ncbi:pyruvate kinase [Patescibacteria group bacterium]|nr:pyruvate kinase [Patescibacteria group bacterium]
MKTKIVATIGPSSLDKNVLKQMIDEGLGIIRINSAYGDFDQYRTILKNLSEVDNDSKIEKMFDIKGEGKLSFCEENKMDFIAVSFAETGQQVLSVKNKFPNAKVISKIESSKGVENYEDILQMSDGVMVARGDLSLAITIEKVPAIQKEFTKIALNNDKYVIAATEMLLSMTEKPYPTNAEVSDVANAVFDKVHAVMLSEETAIGNYPVESVKVMRKVIEDAEKYIY